MRRRSRGKGRRGRTGPRPGRKRSEVAEVAWLEEAQAAIEAGDLERAVVIARRLHARRRVSGFEVEALAHLPAGAGEEAVDVLERGLRLAPKLWSLWQLLGNARSDLGQHDEARAAYERALRCPQVDRESVELNLAVLLERAGRCQDALALTEARGPLALGGRFCVVRASCMARLGRPADARELLRAALAADDETEELAADRRAALLGALAGLSRALDEPDAAREAAREALGWFHGDEQALLCLALLDGVREPGARFYELLLTGDWPRPLEPGGSRAGFHTRVSVVARDLDAALERALALEPEELRATMTLEEHREHEAPPELPSAVYRASRYAVFPLGSDEEAGS